MRRSFDVRRRFPVPLNDLTEDCTIAVKVYDKDLMGSLVDRVRQKGASTAGGTARLVGDGARAAAKGVGRAGLKGVKAVAGWMGGKGKSSGAGDESGVDSGPEVAAAAAVGEEGEEDVGSEDTGVEAEAEGEVESTSTGTGGADGSEVGSGGGGGGSTGGGAAKKGSATFIGSVGGVGRRASFRSGLPGARSFCVYLPRLACWHGSAPGFVLLVGWSGKIVDLIGQCRWCGTFWHHAVWRGLERCVPPSCSVYTVGSSSHCELARVPFNGRMKATLPGWQHVIP